MAEFFFAAMDLANDGWLLDLMMPRHQNANTLLMTTSGLLQDFVGKSPEEKPSYINASDRVDFTGRDKNGASKPNEITAHSAEIKPSFGFKGRSKEELDMLQSHLDTLETLSGGANDAAERQRIGLLAKGIMARVVRPGLRTHRMLNERFTAKIRKRDAEAKRGIIGAKTPRFEEITQLTTMQQALVESQKRLAELSTRFGTLDSTMKIEKSGERARAKALDKLHGAQRFVSNHRFAVMGPVSAMVVLGTIKSLISAHKQKLQQKKMQKSAAS